MYTTSAGFISLAICRIHTSVAFFSSNQKQDDAFIYTDTNIDKGERRCMEGQQHSSLLQDTPNVEESMDLMLTDALIGQNTRWITL